MAFQTGSLQVDNFAAFEHAGRTITLEPGLIGGEVNRLLASYAKKHKCDTQYKIGPDPASIDSCMIGGAYPPPHTYTYAAESLWQARLVPSCAGHANCGRHRGQQLVRYVLRREAEHLPHAQRHARRAGAPIGHVASGV